MFDLIQGFSGAMPVASLEEMIAAAGFSLCIFVVPVVAILTNHQRKMAEIVHRDRPQEIDPGIQHQLSNMHAQIADLRSMMQEHIINNDRPATGSVEQRLNS